MRPPLVTHFSCVKTHHHYTNCLPRRYLITLPPISLRWIELMTPKKIIVQITPKNCHTEKSKQRKKYRTLKKAFRLINIQLWASSEWLSGATDGHSHDTFRMCERARRHEMKINLNQTWKKSFVLWHLIHGFSIMTFINVQLLLIITGVDTQWVAMGARWENLSIATFLLSLPAATHSLSAHYCSNSSTPRHHRKKKLSKSEGWTCQPWRNRAIRTKGLIIHNEYASSRDKIWRKTAYTIL